MSYTHVDSLKTNTGTSGEKLYNQRGRNHKDTSTDQVRPGIVQTPESRREAQMKFCSRVSRTSSTC